jgi:hypothetical protein
MLLRWNDYYKLLVHTGSRESCRFIQSMMVLLFYHTWVNPPLRAFSARVHPWDDLLTVALWVSLGLDLPNSVVSDRLYLFLFSTVLPCSKSILTGLVWCTRHLPTKVQLQGSVQSWLQSEWRRIENDWSVHGATELIHETWCTWTQNGRLTVPQEYGRWPYEWEIKVGSAESQLPQKWDQSWTLDHWKAWCEYWIRQDPVMWRRTMKSLLQTDGSPSPPHLSSLHADDEECKHE